MHDEFNFASENESNQSTHCHKARMLILMVPTALIKLKYLISNIAYYVISQNYKWGYLVIITTFTDKNTLSPNLNPKDIVYRQLNNINHVKHNPKKLFKTGPDNPSQPCQHLQREISFLNVDLRGPRYPGPLHCPPY